MSAAQKPVTGELRWNIKQSFRDYVAELPDGKETRSGELGGSEGGELVFPAVDLEGPDVHSGAFALKFGGRIGYQGHYGMLRVDVRDPWIEVDAAGHTTLTADVAPGGSAAHRATIATVDGAPAANGDGWEWMPHSTRLTLAGATLLGSVYEPGSEADGFSLRVVRA